jgi:hypothetical protein
VKRFPSIVILAVGALGFLVAWVVFPVSKGSKIAPASNPAITEGTFVKGLHYKVYRNGLLVSEAEAEDFKIIPKKFFVFKVKSINEAVITNARIKLFEQNESRESRKKDDPFGSLFREFTDKENGEGLITRATVKGIDVNIYKAEKLTHHLTAASADLKAGANQTAFYNVAIEHPSSRMVIRTEKLLWDTQEKQFKAPGRYTASSPEGEVKGKGIQIDLDFKMRQLRSL